jgi:acyl carrier protein
VRKDPAAIADEMCQFARATLSPAGASFDEHTPLAGAGIESFSLVELLLFSERAFGITIPESHLTPANLATISSIAHCIFALANNGDPSPPASP